jgi:hypothetical protein
VVLSALITARQITAVVAAKQRNMDAHLVGIDLARFILLEEKACAEKTRSAKPKKQESKCSSIAEESPRGRGN